MSKWTSPVVSVERLLEILIRCSIEEDIFGPFTASDRQGASIGTFSSICPPNSDTHTSYHHTTSTLRHLVYACPRVSRTLCTTLFCQAMAAYEEQLLTGELRRPLSVRDIVQSRLRGSQLVVPFVRTHIRMEASPTQDGPKRPNKLSPHPRTSINSSSHTLTNLWTHKYSVTSSEVAVVPISVNSVPDTTSPASHLAWRLHLFTESHAMRILIRHTTPLVQVDSPQALCM
ncbi:hypothetical protein EDC04DRAFT_1647174 [Pisolithus marmoratus]|nr:hypothetical protein EDC04DRAFT_1647174 [Pisolithus marmoratus]